MLHAMTAFGRVALIFLLGVPLSAQTVDQSANSTGDARIPLLIEQLGSDSFQLRERAERELARTGMAGVPRLVEQIISGTPEIAARSARIVQSIGISSAESDMTRVTRVLQLLSQNGFGHLNGATARMADRWKQAQTEKTVTRLKEYGIEFSSGNDALPGVFLDSPQVMMEQPPTPISTPATPPEKPRPSRQQLVDNVNSILTMTDDEIEDHLAETIADTVAAVPSPSYGIPGRHMRVVIDGRIVNLDTEFSDFHSARISADAHDVAEGLRLMKLLPSMPYINFEDREIGDAEIAALSELPRLQAVTLTRCRYDPVKMVEFMKSHPATNVSASGHDAFLGVSLQSEFEIAPQSDDAESTRPVCRVSTVVDDTAAFDAGIQVGDAILEVEGTPVSTFNELVVIIASRQPGDTLRLKILHEDETREETVTLRGRPAGQ